MPIDPITLALLTATATAGANKLFSSFGGGTKDEFKQTRRLRRSQEPLYQQLQESLMNPGAGGAFGDAADYYRDLLNPDSQTAQQMFAPELRRYNEQIIPDLAEQFAGMGSGGLSSSGFRNASINAGTDLSERLGAIRAQLRSQGAQGLANLGQFGLGDFINNVYTQGQPGFFESAGPGIANAGIQTASHFLNQDSDNNPSPSPASGPASPQISPKQPLPNFMDNPRGSLQPQFSTKGKTSPYGKNPMASKIQLPNFGAGIR